MGYTYQLLMAKLTGRCSQSKKLANNTYLERIEGGIAIRLHNTQILRFSNNGDVTIDTGGWMTITTRARLNDYLPVPWRIRQISRVWYIGTVDGGWRPQDQHAVFVDGCTITASGKIVGAKLIGKDKHLIKRKDLERRRINDFATKFIAELRAGKVPPPSGGDCFYCGMVTEDGKGLGEVSGNNRDHLISHLKESYYVPSLLVRAIEKRPMLSQMDRAWLSDRWHNNENGLLGSCWEAFACNRLQKVLANYLFSELGFGA